MNLVYKLDGSDLPDLDLDLSEFDAEERSFLEGCFLSYSNEISSQYELGSDFEPYIEIGCRYEIDWEYDEVAFYPPWDYQICESMLPALSQKTINTNRRAYLKDSHRKATMAYDQGGLKAILPIIQPHVLDVELDSLPSDLQDLFEPLLEPIKTYPGNETALCQSFEKAQSEELEALPVGALPPLLGLLYKGAIESEVCEFDLF